MMQKCHWYAWIKNYFLSWFICNFSVGIEAILALSQASRQTKKQPRRITASTTIPQPQSLPSLRRRGQRIRDLHEPIPLPECLTALNTPPRPSDTLLPSQPSRSSFFHHFPIISRSHIALIRITYPTHRQQSSIRASRTVNAVSRAG